MRMNTDLAKKILEQNAVAIPVAVEDGVCFMVREQEALDAISAALEAALPHLAAPEAGNPVLVSERERFEAWATAWGFMPLGLLTEDPLQYNNPKTDFAWTIWQAAIAALQPVEPSVEEDVYCAIADMIEPYVQREGINPNGELPASVHDSVAILLDHWTKTRQPEGEV